MGRKKKLKKFIEEDKSSDLLKKLCKAQPINIKTVEKLYFDNPKDCKKDNESMSVGYEKIVNDVVMEKVGKKTAYVIIKE